MVPGVVLVSVLDSVEVFSLLLSMVTVGLTAHSLIEAQPFMTASISRMDNSRIVYYFDEG